MAEPQNSPADDTMGSEPQSEPTGPARSMSPAAEWAWGQQEGSRSGTPPVSFNPGTRRRMRYSSSSSEQAWSRFRSGAGDASAVDFESRKIPDDRLRQLGGHVDAGNGDGEHVDRWLELTEPPRKWW